MTSRKEREIIRYLRRPFLLFREDWLGGNSDSRDYDRGGYTFDKVIFRHAKILQLDHLPFTGFKRKFNLRQTFDPNNKSQTMI